MRPARPGFLSAASVMQRILLITKVTNRAVLFVEFFDLAQSVGLPTDRTLFYRTSRHARPPLPAAVVRRSNAELLHCVSVAKGRLPGAFGLLNLHTNRPGYIRV